VGANIVGAVAKPLDLGMIALLASLVVASAAKSSAPSWAVVPAQRRQADWISGQLSSKWPPAVPVVAF
jgi:hypothetical protein